MDLKADPERVAEYPNTGIFVRARNEEGRWAAVDICHLDADSLLEWLRSRGGSNPLAENVVGIVFGHGHIVEMDSHHSAEEVQQALGAEEETGQ